MPFPCTPAWVEVDECRKAGLRTSELELAFRRIAFPSLAAQWLLIRLGSITVAGAVLDSPSFGGSPASRNLAAREL
jgi:hypothetical protein